MEKTRTTKLIFLRRERVTCVNSNSIVGILKGGEVYEGKEGGSMADIKYCFYFPLPRLTAHHDFHLKMITQFSPSHIPSGPLANLAIWRLPHLFHPHLWYIIRPPPFVPLNSYWRRGGEKFVCVATFPYFCERQYKHNLSMEIHPPSGLRLQAGAGSFCKNRN